MRDRAITKCGIGIGVDVAAKERIGYIFDKFPCIYVSFSAGKDSTVLTHLVMDEARKRGRKVGLLFVDLEAQYKLTIDHAEEMYEEYKDCAIPYWVALPIALRNAVSMYQPKWLSWDPECRADWVRTPPKIAITDPAHFPFYKHGMEFEEFVPAFGHWLGGGKATCCFVGIRTDESLNRWRSLTGAKSMFRNHKWTTWCGEGLYNAYPIYDWHVRDIWRYHGKTGLPYNRLYDRMHAAGLTLHQMRICQPYGDDQRKGLWLFHVIEPQTWARVVARVNGANQGALYAQDSGNVLGNQKITLPPGHNWESFSRMLLASMPEQTRDHFEDKISVFLHWYQIRGYPNGIPDDGPLDKSAPSWKRVAKSLLRNDYWCKGLSFTQTKSDAYTRYKRVMKNRRQVWKLI